ncbi:hypothetical protein [Pyrobaculum arsenaticum]|uniref:Uncharacterized protein n=1 Tax=Pyrobaculum arsenaticum (strain DSM 13514 / JCM 11321 / PZ6) TaxID=340102 RepID=A4WJX3_PYRAR|nr:hypothetical protein [Pyrobaculum arsenaticum]ABP50690.1 hypothetical protein Pars_1112 [Pyrobaculum arsenaticum DSM 13514]
MLLVFLVKGLCGGGCGDLGALEGVVGEALGVRGREEGAVCDLGDYVAFCYVDKASKWFDYLVIHKKTPCDGCDGHYYDSDQVSLEEVRRFAGVACSLLERLRGRFYGAVLTRNPFLNRFTFGRTMEPGDLVAYCVTDTPQGAWIESSLLADLYISEVPVPDLEVEAEVANNIHAAEELRNKRFCPEACRQ